MKLAYLIVAHKNPVQLARLVKSLDSQNVEFYIHLDKKVNARPFINELEKLTIGNIYFIKKRVNVIWAGYSQIEAILNSMNEMLERMVNCLNDNRVKVLSSEKTLGKWGHPQTRAGITLGEGDYFVRMNDDNKPYPWYLETLLVEFSKEVDVTYGRVNFTDRARKDHGPSLRSSYLIPQDTAGRLAFTNIDCMNYMVRMKIAKKYSNSWDDTFGADWAFVAALIKNGCKFKFVDRIIGEKC